MCWQHLGLESSLETPGVGMTPEPLPSGSMAKLCPQLCYSFNSALYYILWSSFLKQEPRKECSNQAVTQQRDPLFNLSPFSPIAPGQIEKLRPDYKQELM